MINPVIIFGARGLAIPALEIFKSHNIEVYGFLDDDKDLHKTEIEGITVLGSTADQGFLKLIGKKCDAFVVTETVSERKGLVKFLNERRKVMPTNAIHNNTLIAPSAEISHGLFINAGCVIGAQAKISEHCIIHSNATVEHNARLSKYVQVGSGSIINSNVMVGEGAFIGSGVTIVGGIKVGENSRIGAGSVVVKDVGDGETVFGNPAELVKI